TAASVVARDWSYFEPKRTADVPREPARPARLQTAAAAPVRTAALERPQLPTTAPSAAPIAALPHLPAIDEAKTSLIDFDTPPFPYHGMLPGWERPFLDAGGQSRPAHINFRGRVFWESKTFGDDRVLLHIPQSFDPSRPAVMVVFFHGHGATLA